MKWRVVRGGGGEGPGEGESGVRVVVVAAVGGGASVAGLKVGPERVWRGGVVLVERGRLGRCGSGSSGMLGIFLVWG